MKKALALSTIFISLGLAAPAQVPENGCYARDYDAGHLARNPAQGVAGLRLWVFDEGPSARAALVSALMADQGQGARDGVGGMTLTQYAVCDEGEGRCFVECDGGSFRSRPVAGGIELVTDFFAMGEEGCGGYSDLAEGAGDTVYRLAAVEASLCEALAQTHPLPPEGCWGVRYSDMGRGQGLLGLRLRMGAPDSGFAFAASSGWIAVDLPDGGRAREAGMGGARVQAPVWCGSRDGFCRSGPGEGVFRTVVEGDEVLLVTGGFMLFGLDDAAMDMAMPGQGETRHRLRRLPDDECRGME